MAPVPACIMPLSARSHGVGQTMRNLSDDQYWQLVFPAYDARNHTLPANALTCTGSRVFDDAVFAGGTTRGSPIDIQPGDAQFGNGGDRVRIVWLRTHRWPDGSEAGAMALVRAKEDFAEVYAVGAYRRSNGALTLQAERLGTEVVISATDDGCQGQAKNAPCETSVSLFLPRFGKLVRVATIATEKRAYAQGSEPGIQGQVEYELTASPQYTPGRDQALRAGAGNGSCGPHRAQDAARAAVRPARRKPGAGVGFAVGKGLPRRRACADAGEAAVAPLRPRNGAAIFSEDGRPGWRREGPLAAASERGPPRRARGPAPRSPRPRPSASVAFHGRRTPGGCDTLGLRPSRIAGPEGGSEGSVLSGVARGVRMTGRGTNGRGGMGTVRAAASTTGAAGTTGAA